MDHHHLNCLFFLTIRNENLSWLLITRIKLVRNPQSSIYFLANLLILVNNIGNVSCWRVLMDNWKRSFLDHCSTLDSIPKKLNYKESDLIVQLLKREWLLVNFVFWLIILFHPLYTWNHPMEIHRAIKWFQSLLVVSLSVKFK